MGYEYQYTGTPGAIVYFNLYKPGGVLWATGSATLPMSWTSWSYPGDVIKMCVTGIELNGCYWNGCNCYAAGFYCCAGTNPFGLSRPGGTTSAEQIITVKTAISVLPNPNTGVFSIIGDLSVASAENTADVQIDDVTGKTIYKTTLTADQNKHLDKKITLDNSVGNGIYFIRVKNSEVNEVVRFVLER